ncbi:hypothetical protein FACS189414_4270 [Bacteroidia bacterium]|nr:hypothetical protein AGMMS49574_27970 [Bacteroidia bacterium]GHU77263.1 hypothetical protein FACS189414_4270 [Bacteroidia bacterium]
MRNTILLFAFILLSFSASAGDVFTPGELWLDSDGAIINAHGGGLLYYNNTYYWYGEHKGDRQSPILVGVYSSKDLYTWKNEGAALSMVETDPDHVIARGCNVERPKVIYNEKIKKFVMYFHLELKGQGYNAARVGIATSDKATGPYTFVKSYRPNAGYWPIDMTEEERTSTVKVTDFKDWWTVAWRKATLEGLFNRRDHEGGQMSRDQTVYVDDDGKAYHIFASEENLTLNLAELTDDYLSHTGKYIRIAPGGHNEAPSIFKKDGLYFMVTSGCTGWDPNEGRLFYSNSIWGPWQQQPNPFVGNDEKLSFHSQATYILQVAGKKDAFIYIGDRWIPRNQLDSRYIWLPIQYERGLPVIKWIDKWDLSFFDDSDNQK